MVRVKYTIGVCLVAVICLGSVLTIRAQTCETQSSFTFSRQVFKCKNIVDKFPNISTSATSVSCLDCRIPILNNLPNFTGDTFNVSFSGVQQVKASAFDNFATSVKKINLHNNSITAIESGAFKKFVLLEELTLQGNQLSSINDLFANTIKQLNVSRNHIRDITTCFNGLTVVKIILMHNEISTIKERSFASTKFIKNQWSPNYYSELDVSFNQISSIEQGAFKSDNKIELQILRLSDNILSKINNNTFAGLTDLKTLVLANNFIDTLYAGSFSGLSSLDNLDLRNNKLSALPLGLFSSQEKLLHLLLGNNELTALEPSTFSGLKALIRLDLSNNHLSSIEDKHLFPLGRLSTLDISGNRLQTLDLEKILDHNRLRSLSVNDNFWTCADLIKMYKMMNKKLGGFEIYANHYDVPNLHGIACSRTQIAIEDTTTFEDFLKYIAQDKVFEDIYDSRMYTDDLTPESFADLIKNINGIFNMMLLLTVFVIVVISMLFVQNALRYLKDHNLISKERFSFMYTPTQDNVRLV